MPSPVALVSAALTETVQRIRYSPKYVLTQAWKELCPPFQSGHACGELKTRDPFVQHELEEGADGDTPQEDHSVGGSANRRRHNVTRADARRGHDQAGACEPEEAQGGRRLGLGQPYRHGQETLAFLWPASRR